MSRYLICSDIHRKINNFRLALEEAGKDGLDGVIIAGDFELDTSEIVDLVPRSSTLRIVKGNCDGSNAYGIPLLATFKIGKFNFLLTHGHNYQVKSDLDTLMYVASYQKANVVIYGHTHEYDDHIKKNMRFLNPGSVGSSYYQSATYMIMTIDDLLLSTTDTVSIDDLKSIIIEKKIID